VGVGEPAVEVEHVQLPVPQRTQPRAGPERSREQRAFEAGRIGEGVDREREGAERDGERRRALGQEGPRRRAAAPPARRLPLPCRGENDHHRDRKQAGPLRPERGPRGRPRGEPPRPPQDPARRAPARPGVAIEVHEESRGDGEHRREDVEHRHARLHEVEEVEREQARCERGPAHRPEQAAGEQVQQRDRDEPRERGAGAPAERVVAEHPDAGRDQPLAQRRVHLRLLGGDATDAGGPVDVGAGVLGVVGLVEHERRRVGEPGEADERGERDDDSESDRIGASPARRLRCRRGRRRGRRRPRQRRFGGRALGHAGRG
jgi:hypothetical protein